MSGNYSHVVVATDLHGKKEWNRRSFLRLFGAGALAYFGARFSARADALDNPNFDLNIPADKKLKPDWIKALFERGTPVIYHGDQLHDIGMPISGICTGQELNLSGEGALTGWRVHATPLDIVQGFALRTVANGKTESHILGRNDFPDMTFRGEYPIAKLEYASAAIPVQVSLEAFSPFVPLDADDSGIPATIFNFTLKNASQNPVEATLAAGWENGICGFNRCAADGTRRNQIVRTSAMTVLNCTASPVPAQTDPARPDIVFEDWKKPTYGGWKVEGTAFGPGPAENNWPFEGRKFEDKSLRFANSYISTRSEAATGKLTSSSFTIERNYIRFYFSGGATKGKTCINLVVDGQVVQSRTGRNDNQFTNCFLDAHAFKGKEATLELVDNSGPESTGHITVGAIYFSDISDDGTKLAQLPDYGSMSVALLGKPADLAVAKGALGFDGAASDDASVPLSEPLIGTLGRTVQLNPGESAQVTFILSEFFPNLDVRQLGAQLRYYTNKFSSAQNVAETVADNLGRLTGATRLWRDTWYDSTLPYWFLDRTFANASTLASGTCYRIASGRFYAYEGAPAPNYEGTCTHVWHYAHTMSRTFPELERITREVVDLGVALDVPSGVIGFRGEASPGGLAVDGQTGTIMRFYREHQMSPDDSFLKRNWDKIKLTYNPLFAQDTDEDGILEGRQNNTLDCAWFGQISWMSSMYVGALRAGEAMAREMGDTAFAEKCARIAQNGTRNITSRLYNGEYFFSIPDPKNPNVENAGDGCHIDQVHGQGYALQLGLPRVLPEKETRSALQSIWKYNYSPDAGAYLDAHKKGARYVLPGEAGMIMCTFPRTDWDFDKAGAAYPEINPFTEYFNDTWTGQEYQVAGHMIWEGMVQEGLAIVGTIRDRYNPLKRNPWAEEEAGIHYSRAMASHGVFIAICGYEYHGPKGHLGFAPKLTPENFRAPFTAAEGWGTYAQTIADHKMAATIDLKHGRLKLQTLRLAMDGVAKTATIKANLAGTDVPVTAAIDDGWVKLAFANALTVQAGQKLSVEIG
jgi:non-lysosomal glucosylceramidase